MFLSCWWKFLMSGWAMKCCRSLQTIRGLNCSSIFSITKMESVTPKRRLIPTNLHDVTTQKTGKYSKFSPFIPFQFCKSKILFHVILLHKYKAVFKTLLLLLLLLLLLYDIMSPVTGISSRYFSWTSGDPHRSRFKLHTAVLSVLCAMFQV